MTQAQYRPGELYFIKPYSTIKTAEILAVSARNKIMLVQVEGQQPEYWAAEDFHKAQIGKAGTVTYSQTWYGRTKRIVHPE